jgi:hypothetical protein
LSFAHVCGYWKWNTNVVPVTASQEEAYEEKKTEERRKKRRIYILM